MLQKYDIGTHTRGFTLYRVISKSFAVEVSMRYILYEKYF